MSASYRMYWYWKYQLWATAALFALVAVLFAILAVESRFIGGLAFLLVWVGIAGFSVHWLYFQVGSALTVREGLLIWSTRSGRAVTKQLSQLRRVQPWRRGSMSVLVFSDGSELLVRVHKGFSDFTGLLQERQPWLQVRLSTYGSIVDRLWGPSGFRRRR